MATDQPLTFGQLLRRARRSAGLTQEVLAEQAGISVRTLSDLERGLYQRPHRDTVQLLADALRLSEEERRAFEAAGRRDANDANIHPCLRSLVPRRSNLPDQPTPFIGREQETAAVITMLQRPEVRLLTLTGPGGTGKTRLALQVAAHVQEDYAGGVCFVSLASLGDPDLVPAAIATVLGVQEAAGQPVLQTLTQYLRPQHVLLLLDNFEHLLDAAPLVATVTTACPLLTVLVTSRAVLHLGAEHTYAVPPMTTPNRTDRLDLETLPTYDAVALFMQRAQAAKFDFGITHENAPIVADICCRLDGLPLAIELAAARVRLFPPMALLGRLSSRLTLLSAGARDAPARHRTLRGTIDWSYELLDEGEQRLFARMSVFTGGCTFEAAEAVCNREGDLGIGVLEGIAALVDQSLLGQEGENAPRFMMLETIQEYAADKLLERGEAETIRAAHAEYFLRLAEEAEPELTGPRQVEWLRRLETELDNLRTGLTFLLRTGEMEKELRMATAMFGLWYARGYWSEGHRWLEEGLARGERVAPIVRARAVCSLGASASDVGDYKRASALLEEALELFRQLGDQRGSAEALSNLGNVAGLQGQYERATGLFEESERLWRDLGSSGESAGVLNNLGLVAADQGDLATATGRFEEALAIFRAMGDTQGIAITAGNLGWVAQREGNLARAEALQVERLALARDLGAPDLIALALSNLSEIARLQGQQERAKEWRRESLLLVRDVGDRYLTLRFLGNMATLALAGGDAEAATYLRGAEAAWRERLGMPLPPADQAEMEEMLTQVKGLLGEKGFALAWGRGQAMSLEDVVAYALGE